eukprot:g9058.t1
MLGREASVLLRWRSLCRELGVEDALAEEWGNQLREGYSEDGRHYHTLEHLADMLEHADSDFPSLRHPPFVQLAIFFHDLVYDPKSGTNEEDSEALFAIFAGSAGLKPPDSRKVSEYIIATKRHDASASDDQDLRAFIDLDMAVMGRERSAYLAYASQIRQEYIHVPVETYCQKRAEVLRDFLAKGSIFSTEEYRRTLETPARANVAAEVPSVGKAGGKVEYCRDHAEDGMVDVVSKRCADYGCIKVPSCGIAGGKVECCRDHAKDGMVSLKHKRCTHNGCMKWPSFGKAGGKVEYCRDHAEDGMVDVKNKRCAHHGCTKQPSCGIAGGKVEYCRGHVEDGMVDMKTKRCNHYGCTKAPSFGKAGGKVEYCRDHAEDGMVSLKHKRCTHDGCMKRPSFGKAGGKVEYCRDHAKDEMVNLKNKKCTHNGCMKRPSFGIAGGKVEYCLDHAEDGMLEREDCRDHTKGGMVDVKDKRCTHSDCIKRPSVGKAGSKAEYCGDHAKVNLLSASNRKPSAYQGDGGSTTTAGDNAARRGGAGVERGRSAALSSAATETFSASSGQGIKRARRTANPGTTPTPFAAAEGTSPVGSAAAVDTEVAVAEPLESNVAPKVRAPATRGGRFTTSTRAGASFRAASETGVACETKVVISSPLAFGSGSDPTRPRVARPDRRKGKRSRKTMVGAGSTSAGTGALLSPEPFAAAVATAEEEAAVSASTHGDEAISAKRGRVR